jgi:hypothetical protein
MKGLATLIVAATFLFLSLDGYHNGIVVGWNGSLNFYGEPPFINWAHGWPCHFLVRRSIYDRTVGKGPPNPRSMPTEQLGYYSRWPFDEAPITLFRALPLAIDAAVFAFLLAGTWLGAAELSRLFPLRFRFSVKSLLALTTLVAVVLALQLPSRLPRYAFQYAAFVVIAVSAAVAIGGYAASVVRVVGRRQRQPVDYAATPA